MDKFMGIFFLLLTMAASTYAQNCSDFAFSNGNRFATCNPLPVLNSFLHWTYHQSNHTADIAYRHGGVAASSWVAWGLNLRGSGMIGAQSLVALRNSNGDIHVYTSPVSSYATQLQQGALSFRVPKISAELTNGGEMIIFATLELPAGGRTTFNHVWQNGPLSGTNPVAHSMSGNHLRSVGTVDFASG